MAEVFEHPYYPIIYVRGYAATQGEIEETVADPYMGFNLGSTKIRQAWTGDVEKFIFESPLVRLMKDFGYRDVFEAGDDMPLGRELKPRSIIVYRYYESASRDLGAELRGEIENYATGLARLILKVYDRFKERIAHDPGNFKVYLVAHSMGGLICRCFLQNDNLGGGSDEFDLDRARKMVDKVFTYATPHNGIDVRLVGNIPGFITKNNIDNFNRWRMQQYLETPVEPESDDVSSLNGKFDPNRFFCLVGTNHRDYLAAHSLASKIVGPMSDGLVKIENATVWGPIGDAGGQTRRLQSPRAFVHRSHSGHYGIVNSEEGYQNLTRFLFGNVRVDARLIVHDVALPPAIQKKHDAGADVRASYNFEVILRVRGKRWDLHRRVADEASAIFRKFDEMLRPHLAEKTRHPFLFSVFLSFNQRVNRRRASLGFSLDLGVLIPEYEVDGFLFLDKHYEGGYLYRDKINLEAIPPGSHHPVWRVRYGLDSRTPNRSTKTVEPLVHEATADPERGIIFHIPISQKSRPGLTATLELEARPWNNLSYPGKESQKEYATVTSGGTKRRGDDGDILMPT